MRGFYLAVGEHYGVPEREVVVVHERKIPDEELPVVYFIARRAHVSPETVIRLRLRGRSWMDISAHFGLAADVFYVPLKRDPGPPYGKAYGHFKKGKHRKKIVLSDEDIVNLINLRFISEYYGCAPEDVVRMRSEGRSFVEINQHVKKGKHHKADGSPAAASDGKPVREASANGKGSGKKK